MLAFTCGFVEQDNDFFYISQSAFSILFTTKFLPFSLD